MISINRITFPTELRHLRGILPPHEMTLADLASISGPVVAALATSQVSDLAPKWIDLAVRVAETHKGDLPPVAVGIVERMYQGESPITLLDSIQRVRTELTHALTASGVAHFDWPVGMQVLHSAAMAMESWKRGQPALAARWLAETIDAALVLHPQEVAEVCQRIFGGIKE